MNTLSDTFGISNKYKARAPVNRFQAQGANLDNATYAPTIESAQAQATGGAGPATETIGRQNSLSDMLTASANGTGGPSAAQALLAQATQRNINTAAGQSASARGVNPAMAARLAVNAAGQANQEAAATGATLRAQEQIAAREQLGRNLAATGQVQIGQQGMGAQVLGTAGGLQNAQNAARIQNALGTQGINAGVASQNAALDLGAQQIDAGVAAQNAGINTGLFGGLINGAGNVAAMFAAHGGEIPAVPSDPAGAYLARLHGYADGGSVGGSSPLSGMGDALAKGAAAGHDAYREFTSRPVLGAMYANGGSIYLDAGGDPAGQVPGKAVVAGDSPTNDRVHAMLSPGEIVIPRSIVQGKNAPEKAASFVASVLRRHGGKRRLAAGGKVAVVTDPRKTGVPVPPSTPRTSPDLSTSEVTHLLQAVTEADKKKQQQEREPQDLSEGGLVQPFMASKSKAKRRAGRARAN